MYSEKYQLAGEVDEIVIDTANKRIIIVDDKPDGNAHKSEKIQVEAYCLLFRECYLNDIKEWKNFKVFSTLRNSLAFLNYRTDCNLNDVKENPLSNLKYEPQEFTKGDGDRILNILTRLKQLYSEDTKPVLASSDFCYRCSHQEFCPANPRNSELYKIPNFGKRIVRRLNDIEIKTIKDIEKLDLKGFNILLKTEPRLRHSPAFKDFEIFKESIYIYNKNKIVQKEIVFLPNLKNILFVDIETDRYFDKIWLIGILYNNQFHRFYAENWENERQVIINFLEYLKSLKKSDLVLISYSGNNFEFSTILNSINRNKIDNTFFLSLVHIDLGKIIDNSCITPFKPNKFKDVASLMGFKFRYPNLKGLDVAIRYEQHINEDVKLTDDIFEYNEDDVRGIEYILSKLKIEEKRNLSQEEINKVKTFFESCGNIEIRKDPRNKSISTSFRFNFNSKENIDEIISILKIQGFKHGKIYQNLNRTSISFYGKQQVTNFIKLFNPKIEKDLRLLNL